MLMNVKTVVVGTYNGKVFVITDHRASIASPTVARKSSWGVRHYCLRLRGTDQVLRYVLFNSECRDGGIREMVTGGWVMTEGLYIPVNGTYNGGYRWVKG
ncbi:hypothetical protein HOLleu_31297 [Holothuria leucospilota]|uniref:Uncharacterized protein n=1 Tax=Holothuria leucospilota TaxID=206669 RepID=A0A9Q0YQ78_HOLLE|nr:hypothetical protein HOLleu_31297 [Holothuria leucospilota]